MRLDPEHPKAATLSKYLRDVLCVCGEIFKDYKKLARHLKNSEKCLPHIYHFVQQLVHIKTRGGDVNYDYDLKVRCRHCWSSVFSMRMRSGTISSGFALSVIRKVINTLQKTDVRCYRCGSQIALSNVDVVVEVVHPKAWIESIKIKEHLLMEEHEEKQDGAFT